MSTDLADLVAERTDRSLEYEGEAPARDRLDRVVEIFEDGDSDGPSGPIEVDSWDDLWNEY